MSLAVQVKVPVYFPTLEFPLCFSKIPELLFHFWEISSTFIGSWLVWSSVTKVGASVSGWIEFCWSIKTGEPLKNSSPFFRGVVETLKDQGSRKLVISRIKLVLRCRILLVSKILVSENSMFFEVLICRILFCKTCTVKVCGDVEILSLSVAKTVTGTSVWLGKSDQKSTFEASLSINSRRSIVF